LEDLRAIFSGEAAANHAEVVHSVAIVVVEHDGAAPASWVVGAGGSWMACVTKDLNIE
jgi:hypothetical protein